MSSTRPPLPPAARAATRRRLVRSLVVTGLSAGLTAALAGWLLPAWPIMGSLLVATGLVLAVGASGVAVTYWLDRALGRASAPEDWPPMPERLPPPDDPPAGEPPGGAP